MIRFRGICISFLILASSCMLYVRADQTYELPTSIQPDHYHLKIITQLEDEANLTFHGEVSIRFQVTEDTKNITLHARELGIDDARIELKSFEGQENISPCILGVDRKKYFYIIHLCQALTKSSAMYELKLYFAGTFADSYPGFSQHSYVDTITNETRRYAVTEFYPNGAHLSFPCFDEPQYKAKFTIWFGHHNSRKALSNMPLEKQIPLEGLTDFVWSIFEESPPMSTYSVAFTLNDFVYIESQAEDSDVILRTWCRPDHIDKCKYASEEAPKILKRFEQLFGLSFPLKKLDQIAVDNYNGQSRQYWGLIIYGEGVIQNSQIIALQLASQWFGNLVTPTSWTDSWLYNAIATHMTSLVVEPSLDYNFLMNTDFWFNSAMSADASNSGSFKSPKKGTQIFSMIYSILDQGEFFEAIRDFLTKNQYKNAGQMEFWNTLNEKAHKYKRISPQVHLKTIVDSWTLQTGFPAINITRNYETGSMEISQHLFLHHFNFELNEPAKCFWIPLSYTTASEFDFSTTTPKAWLECNESDEAEPLELQTTTKRHEWVIFNIQSSVVAKIMYDNENWRLIAETLRSDRFTNIPYLNRFQFVNDLTTFARNGEVSYATVLDVLEYLVKERDYQLWSMAIWSFEEVFDLLRSFPEHLAYFKAYMRYLIEPIYYHVHGLNHTVESSNFNIKHLIANFACKVELEDCVNTAMDYFQKWKNSANPNEDNTIPEDIQDIVYKTAIRFGNADDWTFLWQQYRPNNSWANKELILKSLACTRNETILRNYIDLLFDKESALSANFDRKNGVEGIVSCGFIGSSLVWDYIVKHHNTLRDDFADVVNEAVDRLFNYIISNEDRRKLSDFIDSNKEYIKNSYGFRYSYQTIDTNIQWMERSLGDIIPFLKSRLTSIGILDNIV